MERDFILENCKVDHLPPDVREEYINLLIKYKHIIGRHEYDVGSSPVGKMPIELKTTMPISLYI